MFLNRSPGALKLLPLHRKRMEEKDNLMTPTELFASALGACIGIYVVKFCKRHNLPTEGLKISLDWTRAEDPARIDSFQVKLNYPHPIGEGEKMGLLRFADSCFITQTINHRAAITVELEP